MWQQVIVVSLCTLNSYWIQQQTKTTKEQKLEWLAGSMENGLGFSSDSIVSLKLQLLKGWGGGLRVK